MQPLSLKYLILVLDKQKLNYCEQLCETIQEKQIISHSLSELLKRIQQYRSNNHEVLQKCKAIEFSKFLEEKRYNTQ